MNADEMRKLRHRVPFEPFELILSSGDRYPVYHPESMLILKNRMLVGIDFKGSEKVPGGYEILRYADVLDVKPLSNRRPRKTA